MADEVRDLEVKEEEMVQIKKTEYENLLQVSKDSSKVIKAFNKLMDIYMKQYSNQLVKELLADEEETK